MARTVRIKVFKFSELSEQAKKKAIEKFSEINVDHKWWEYLYEDAERVKLKLTGFDLYRHQVDGEFIEGAEDTAHLIKTEHGPDCLTYQTAKDYLKQRDGLIDTFPKDEQGEIDENALDEKLDELDRDFLQAILEGYRALLQQEYDYQTSEEAIIETIEANDYEFTQDGRRF